MRFPVSLGAVVAVTCLAVVAVLTRVTFLGDRPLFRDEAASWLASTFTPDELVIHLAGEPYPPLYPLLLRAWTGAFGDSEAALRSMSVVAGLVVVAVGATFAWQALGRRAGIVALALIAASPIAILNARDARMYALESAFAAGAWWLLWRQLQPPPEGRHWRLAQRVALPVCVAGQLWTLPFGLPLVGLQLFAAVAASWPSLSRARPAVLGVAIGMATYLPWLPRTLDAAAGGSWTPRPNPGDLANTVMASVADVANAPALLSVGALLVGVAVLGIAAAIFRPDWLRAASDRRLLSPTAIRDLGIVIGAGAALAPAVWLVSQVQPVYDTRYFGPIVVPMALGVVAGLEALRYWAGARWLAAGIIVVMLTVAVNATAWQGSWRDPQDLAPTEPLMETIRDHAEAGDVLLALDPRSYFTVAYSIHRGEIDGFADLPLLVWDSGSDPVWFGGSLIPADRKLGCPRPLEPSCVHAIPGLAPGGRVLLVALANGTTDDLNFEPLDAGHFREVARHDVTRGRETGQLRILIPAATAD